MLRLMLGISVGSSKSVATLCFCTNIPIHSEYEPVEYDWLYSVYGCVQEDTSGFSAPKGKPVHISVFDDANLLHDFTTGHSATEVLMFLNQTLIDWFSKHRNTVKTATYGSEFTAARISTDFIVDLHYTLCSLGTPLDGPAWMFGDNRRVVT